MNPIENKEATWTPRVAAARSSGGIDMQKQQFREVKRHKVQWGVYR